MSNGLVSFSKYHGTGNDFILIDDREKNLSLQKRQIATLCYRHYGIGANGLIILRPSQKGDVFLHIFNSDGKETGMCGNGLRCAAHFLKKLGEKRSNFTMETKQGLYPCKINGREVEIIMPPPRWIEERGKISIHGGEIAYSCIDAGVPHLVSFVSNMDMADFAEKSRELRRHLRFAPDGVNVNFIKAHFPSTLFLRTYERGVEEETLSCGTGGAAAAVVAVEMLAMEPPIQIEFFSGERLQFDFIRENRVVKKIVMRGEVRHVFDGRVKYENLRAIS